MVHQSSKKNKRPNQGHTQQINKEEERKFHPALPRHRAALRADPVARNDVDRLNRMPRHHPSLPHIAHQRHAAT
jgi:hypothetical protein